jgi:NADPH:quinone reductase-like Zn-dependent oxidoreductase
MSEQNGQALVVRSSTGDGSQKLHKEAIPIPKPEPHQAVVKVSYAAQNPTDSKLNILCIMAVIYNT